MNDKSEYTRDVQNELAEWQDEIYKFKVVAEDTGLKDPDRQIRYYQIIEDITAQKQDVTERLSSLENIDETDWSAKKDEIDSLRKEVAEAIAAAKSDIT